MSRGNFKHGNPKPPGSGRKKGTPNKRQKTLDEKLADLGFDAVAEMIALLRTEISEASRVKLLCELAQYQFPKLKSIEHSGEGGEPMQIDPVRLIISGA